MKKRTLILFGAVAGIIGVLSVGALCTNKMAGEVLIKSAGGQEGYMLVAPYRIDMGEGEASKGEVKLVSKDGFTLHAWETEAPVQVAQLQKNATLFVSMTPKINHHLYPGFGTTGVVQQLDWEGNILWEHNDPLMTLDFEVFPDGAIAYLAWSPLPQSFSMGVPGGYRTASSSMWGNDIVKVNREGEEVWRWKMSDHLRPSDYVINDFAARPDFSHANSLRYAPTNPLTNRPVFVMSARHISTVFVIDAETGEVIWRSPKGLFSMQHDAILLPGGTLTVFDNGFARDQISALMSRAIEVSLPEGNEVWKYDGGTTMTSKAQFATSIMGSAQRLSNGNTFMTLSTAGRMLEVTPDGTPVFEYHDASRDEDGEARIVFRTRLYEPGGSEWEKKIAAAAFFGGICRAVR